MKIIRNILIILICLLIDWNFSFPYYESRGRAGIFAANSNWGISYTWADKGFNEKYTPQLELHFGDQIVFFPKYPYRK